MTKELKTLFLPTKVGFFTPFYQLIEKMPVGRFVPMQKGLCYDSRVNGCWIGICGGEGESRYVSLSKEEEDLIYFQLERLFGKYLNPTLKVEIPLIRELSLLREFEEPPPFEIVNGRPAYPDNWVVGKGEDGKIYLYDLETGNFLEEGRGYLLPIVRLGDPNPNLEEKLKGWLLHRLIPQSLSDPDYLKLMVYVGDRDLRKLFIPGITERDLEIPEVPLEKPVEVDLVAEDLLRFDSRRASLTPYPKSLLFNFQQGGLWELHRFEEPKEGAVEVELSKGVVSRDPMADVIRGGVVGIDFGTKSTVVAYQDFSEEIKLIPVGITDWQKMLTPKDYENPTCLQFIDFAQFIEDYREEEYRPFTKWDDLLTSHEAWENMHQVVSSEDYDSFLTGIKRWAALNNSLKIKDKKGNTFEWGSYLEYTGPLPDPVEIYAYYLGLYINTQHLEGSKIFPEYIISFPVSFERRVREKILESFKRGLIKALPYREGIGEIIRVKEGISEPVAYAAAALEYLNNTQWDHERIFYGVFDFGGGTTDFDFGIFRASDEDNEDEAELDYVIERYDAGGDLYLGGEELLARMASRIFIRNQEVLLENWIPFSKHPEEKGNVSPILINNSREARRNTVVLMEKLRPFWESSNCDESFFEEGVIEVALSSAKDNTTKRIELEVDPVELAELVRSRIKEGVERFFVKMKRVLEENEKEIKLKSLDKIYILLAGNSSRSPIVQQIFKEKLEEFKRDYRKEIEIVPPLEGGTDEYGLILPSCKTGVAMGLLLTKEGGRIKVINHDFDTFTQEVQFKYYLGKNRRNRFRVVVDRDTPYGEWIKFGIATTPTIYLYYTSDPQAITGEMPIHRAWREKIEIPEEFLNPRCEVYISLLTPNEIEIGVSEGGNSSIEPVQKITLKDKG